MSDVFATKEMERLKHTMAPLLALINMREVRTNHLHPIRRVEWHEELDRIRMMYDKPMDATSTVHDLAGFQVACGRLLFLTDFVLVDHLSEVDQAKWGKAIASARKVLV